MMVLRRRSGQALLLGECVRAVVVAVDRDRVQVRIEAPQSFQVEHRVGGETIAADCTCELGDSERLTISETWHVFPERPAEIQPPPKACRNRANPRPWLPDECVGLVVVGIGQGSVKLGIEAPRWMTIRREEVQHAIDDSTWLAPGEPPE
jgi:sRNA-binding carbon storage regulator CsrA